MNDLSMLADTQAFTQERRQADKAILILIREILDNQHAVDKKLTDHIDREEKLFRDQMATLEGKAFPDADPEGHRRHHEAVIRSAEQKAEFWEDMKRSVSRWGIIGVLGFLAMAAWVAFLKGPKS